MAAIVQFLDKQPLVAEVAAVKAVQDLELLVAQVVVLAMTVPGHTLGVLEQQVKDLLAAPQYKLLVEKLEAEVVVLAVQVQPLKVLSVVLPMGALAVTVVME